MTAAHADDPTIAQEQNQEKRVLLAAIIKPQKKEEAKRVENTEEKQHSSEIMKHATGGTPRDKVEILHQEKSLTCSFDNADQKKRESDISTSEGIEVLEKDRGNSNGAIDARRIEDEADQSKIEEASVDHEARKSKALDWVLSTTKVASDCVMCIDQDATSKMRLNDLCHSIEEIDDEAKDAASFELARTFLEESYDPESEFNFHEAVRAGDAKCVAALYATGSVENLDEPDWNVSGDPPLLVAATNHCLPVLSLLLVNGCDPGVRSPRGETALHRVILNGGPGNVYQFVVELLKYGCPPGVKEAGGGLTALHVLTRQLAHAQGSKNLHHNFEEALKTLDLLARAGPVNAKDHQGRSALHILASSTIFDNNHRTEIESLIETLLAAGADPSLKNDRGETPLHECLECGALNTAFLLVQHTPTGIMSRYGETPLHIASRKNYADMVGKLLEHGEDPSVQDAGGNTPLHLASARGFHQTVSLLVTSPLAQLEKLNIEGLTALQVAAESGFVNAVRLLLKAGADPSQTVHYCAAILHRHPDISLLIDHELTRRRQLAA